MVDISGILLRFAQFSLHTLAIKSFISWYWIRSKTVLCRHPLRQGTFLCNQPTEPLYKTETRWMTTKLRSLYGNHFFMASSTILWRVANNMLPTLERLAKIKNEIPTDCYLCGDELESSHHILLSCPIANLLWWNSNWQIRLEVSNIWRWINGFVGC